MGGKQYKVWHATVAGAVARGLGASAAAREAVAAHPGAVTFQAARYFAMSVQKGDETRGRGADPSTPPAAPETIASPLLASPVSLDELFVLFKLDRAEWDVIECTPNVWQIGAKHPDTGQILTAPLYQLKARLKPKAAPSLVLLKDALLADIRAEATAPAIVRHALPAPAERHMLEVSAFDVHFGKLAWREEAGADYDLSIARARFRDTIEDLIAKSAGFPTQRILFPIGNDALQTDNIQGTTTGGTPQDTDSRYHKAFRHARSSLAWAIDRLAGIAPVLVIVVPGNHDRLAAFHMGEVLEAQFASDPRVTVNNGPKLRKYVTFGVNLLGFTHGSEEKMNDLPLIMAREEPEAWAAATHYEWHIGHQHKSKEVRYTAGDSFNGVRVRILPALCEADAWHYSRGYVGERMGAECYLWNFSTGYAGHLSSSVLETRGAA